MGLSGQGHRIAGRISTKGEPREAVLADPVQVKAA